MDFLKINQTTDTRKSITRMLEQLLFAQELWFIHNLKICSKKCQLEFLYTQKAKSRLEILLDHITRTYRIRDVDCFPTEVNLPFDDKKFFHVQIKWYPDPI